MGVLINFYSAQICSLFKDIVANRILIHANRSDEAASMAEETLRCDFFVGKAALVGLDPGVNIGPIVDDPAAQLGIAGAIPGEPHTIERIGAEAKIIGGAFGVPVFGFIIGVHICALP